jgi:hypothetical protein
MMHATGQPYIVMGDFNLSARQVNDWLRTNHWLHSVVLDVGATCLGKSDIDFMLVSRPVMHQCTELLRHKTTLATHDPISLQLSRPDDPEYHYEAWDPPKRVVVGQGPRPRYQCDASHHSWTAKISAFRALPTHPLTMLTFVTPSGSSGLRNKSHRTQGRHWTIQRGPPRLVGSLTRSPNGIAPRMPTAPSPPQELSSGASAEYRKLELASPSLPRRPCTDGRATSGRIMPKSPPLSLQGLLST